MSNCLKVMKVVITAAGAMMGRIAGTVMDHVRTQNPAPSRVALS